MKVARVVPIDSNRITARDEAGNTGWVHDCGAFVYSSTQPERCGVCWSALHNRQAHNGNWRPAYIDRSSS